MDSMDPRITADEIEIGDWYGLPGDRCDGYRAAFVGESVLTGPEHAHLSDEDLLTEAVAEARRADILAEPAHIATDPTDPRLLVDDPDGRRFLVVEETVEGFSLADPAGGRFWPADGSTPATAVESFVAGDGEWHS
jgi:hypothetical protein